MLFARVPLAAVVLGSVACATMQPVTQPAEFIASKNPKVVYVTYDDNSIIGVVEPRMSGDNLVGRIEGLGEPVTVRMSDVRQLQAVQSNGRRTTMAVVASAAAMGGILYALSKPSDNNSYFCDAHYHPEWCEGREPPPGRGG